MDIDEWIEENKDDCIDACMDGFTGNKTYQAIKVSALRELLKTHKLVPNEPTEENLEKAITAWFEYKLDDIDDYQLRMMKAHKVLIGANDE